MGVLTGQAENRLKLLREWKKSFFFDAKFLPTVWKMNFFPTTLNTILSVLKRELEQISIFSPPISVSL